MLKIKVKGKFEPTRSYLKKNRSAAIRSVAERYASQGVSALAAATPVDSGATANSWDYDIQLTKDSVIISWTNTNVVDGVPIAVLLQYGHGTQNGGYVTGRDYINPALRPIFDAIAENAWKEVNQT